MIINLTAGERIRVGEVLRITKRGTAKKLKPKKVKRKGHAPIGVAMQGARKGDKLPVAVMGGDW